MSEDIIESSELSQAVLARKTNFARRPVGSLTRDRAMMAVSVAVRADGSSPSAPTVDPAAIAEAQRRFTICKTCEHSSDDGFACDLYTGCCFGRFRSIAESSCPDLKW